MGMGEGANVNHHLSLPESGWLRLLVDIFWGLIVTNPGAPRTLREVLAVNLIRILTGQSGP